jgi:hypothetical protein
MKNGLTINQYGTKQWFLNGQLHRVDGPAIEWSNGAKNWYLNGQLHRVDGPAVEHAVSIKFWYYRGTQIKCQSQTEFERYLKLKAFW